ncbi:MAG: DUF4332 domain-containing protein [Acidobacteriota bacterium]|nr:DUF4332 domain-containing protein [Acidobacteriota bacterium]
MDMTAKQTGYMPDLSKIRLDAFGNELKTGRLLPSRRPLLEDIDARLALLEKEGLTDAGALKEALSSHPKIKQLAQKTGIPEDYLTLLKREVNNLSPTPVKFSDIPNISAATVKKLNDLNINSTEDLFPYIKDTNSRKKFELKSGFSTEEILWLTRLVDVSRIKWVGPKLAGLIVDTKYDTVEKLALADPADLLNAFNEAKKIHKAYQGALGINDIDSWIRQVVKKTPLVIEYK